MSGLKLPGHTTNHRLVLTSPDMSHKPGRLKFSFQDPGVSEPGYVTLVPKETFQNSNHQKLIGSTYDHLKFILKKICHVRDQNNIATPLISNMYKRDITESCKILHRKYVEITKIYRHHNVMQTSL